MIDLINIAVVDDEEMIREQIRGLIKGRFADCHVEAYATGEELLAVEKYYDVIFLDIQMKWMNGIDVARKLREQRKESVLIFITGIKEYVFEAFDVSAFHYLLKPIEPRKFESVFEKAILEIEKRRKQERELLFIKTRNRNMTLNQSGILYIENRGKKVEIHTTKEMIEMYASMSSLEKQLNGSFYRCHRGYLVNMAHIAEYESDRICLSNGETIFMAKERYNLFVKEYMRYLRKGGGTCV